jgi:hypothetical protein
VRHFGQGVHFAVQKLQWILAQWSIAGNGLSVHWNCWRLVAASTSFAWEFVRACHTLNGWKTRRRHERRQTGSDFDSQHYFGL